MTSVGTADGAYRGLAQSYLMLHLDLAGTIAEANSLFVSLCGLSGSQLVGKAFRDILVAQTPIGTPSLLLSKIDGFDEGDGLRRLQCADGSERWLNATFSPIDDSQGQRAGFLMLAFLGE